MPTNPIPCWSKSSLVLKVQNFLKLEIPKQNRHLDAFGCCGPDPFAPIAAALVFYVKCRGAGSFSCDFFVSFAFLSPILFLFSCPTLSKLLYIYSAHSKFFTILYFDIYLNFYTIKIIKLSIF